MSSSKTNPSHYVKSSGVEVIDITETLDFCRGNVVKYVARAGSKDGESEFDDLLKAQWYLERSIKNLTQSYLGRSIKNSKGRIDG